MAANESAPRAHEGTGVTPLSGVGTAVWYDPNAELELGEPPAAETVDPDAERERFEDARDRARAELERERERTAERVGEDEAAVFDAHKQFVDDPQIIDGVEAAVDDGLPAEHAVDAAFEDPIAQFEGMDGRMAERADDLRDVRDRLLRLLTDADRVDLASLSDGSILLAERLTPSDTAQLDPERVAGFATIEGGRTSHAAIFARSLGIPAVVGVGDGLESIDDGADVLIDGEEGTVIANPTPDQRERAAGGRDVEIREDPVETADGRAVEVAANVGTLAELEGAVAQGADGIGLFRTEFLFLDREAPPDEDEQFEVYREALAAFPEGRVVVRTLDVGGDKPIPYLETPDADNPFLGQRGIRRSLGPDADLFETQLRALLRAAAAESGTLSVMFPMVATVPELEAALETVADVAADLESEGIEHERPELGAMIETPSAAFIADELAERVDFLSIGTNDLTQYVMAAARENERVADLRDPCEPAVLRAIERTVAAADAGDAWVGMCGEMAGDPDLAPLLVGLGLDELSMSAVTIPEVKAAIANIETDAAEALANRATDAATRTTVYEHVNTTTDQ
ncbi:phosphoenolpyruvate-protein phosphotransferase [Haloterrigena turkmenica DSM 5511]|uniref:Phosphoenolpyruvate-protein phosphotransferase n=1 Tax=Haloterrigena turkmenica (strain ATCC 51198 / DSM 5511 / JCM 9101 / NCIMB 13204 / VKM B-1734 / 4k) TaxID=543526 RepID=D2RXA5_HALTV|nr:phosphoenolpyruvate--protein phosphotransferase [Haloterrigena turkmenica]ADB61629.1 phosphoenolpyruvate-protein phosphotransferase [Haloterrigena turkmenica DSM 5511]